MILLKNQQNLINKFMNEITIQNALATNDFRFRENDKLTIDFVNSLKIKDLFFRNSRT